MGSLHIRNLPEDVYQALRARARRENRTLTQQVIVELRRVPEWEQGVSRPQLLEQLRNEARERGVRALSRPPEEVVREDRDR